MLKEAFDKAVMEDHEKITFLKNENNIEKIEVLFNLYHRLSDRQKKNTTSFTISFIKNK